jgi:regulator of cell morphogenesis and NO signaling
MRLGARESIENIAVSLPAAIPVFDHYRIRFCGDDRITLEEACRTAGAPLAEVLEALRSLVHPGDGDRRDWDHAPLTALVRFILDHHHTREIRLIETVQRLFDRVTARHGDEHSELRTLQNLFERMASGLRGHMKREETSLFPAFREEVAPGAGENARRETARRCIPLIAGLERDHQVFRTEWAEIRSLAGGYKPPSDACTGLRALYGALEGLDQYQHEHIQKEDTVLFRRIRTLAT